MRRRVAIRKLALVIPALLVLMAASLVSPLGALAASSGSPVPPEPNSGEPHYSKQAPSGRLPAAPFAPLVAAVTCDGGFNVVASPNGASDNELRSTSAVSAADVYAVGTWTKPGPSFYSETLLEHFDGNSWSIIPTPSLGPLSNRLNGVFATSTNDIWMVGASETVAGFSNANAFAWHWDGSTLAGYWLPPFPGNLYSELYAVTATSSNDAWAVGTYYLPGPPAQYLPLIYHWNGSAWSMVSINAPNATGNRLFAVSAFSPTDVWAVGRTQPPGFPFQSYAAHLSGATWTNITTPNTTGRNIIWGVNALEANHAVGVGYGNFVPPPGGAPRQSQAWDLIAPGTSTMTVLGNTLGTLDNNLLGVARSGNIVQAVGYRNSTGTSGQNLVIPGMWDPVGHTLAWGAPGPTANPGSDNALISVTALSPYAFWATGSSNATGAYQTLTELYCALRFSVVSSTPTYVGIPFSLTLTAQNPNSTTATGYRGTVHFTSTDPQAVLPPDYTYTSGDAGTHTFTGVVLNNSGTMTITASDNATPFVKATATFNISCLGACPGPGGTAGARDASAGVAGVAGARDANQSGTVAPPPRKARLGGVLRGDGLSAVEMAMAIAAAPSAASRAPEAAVVAAVPAEAEIPVNSAPEISTAAIDSRDAMMAASNAPAVKVENSPGYLPLVFLPLTVISIVLLEIRRRNRRLIGHSEP